MTSKSVFLGNIVTSSVFETVKVFSGFICVENGKISKIGENENFSESKWPGYNVVYLGPNQFLMPGFVDCHTHAPQFPNIGLGLDKPLLEWLDKYTFPLEKKYEDIHFAEDVYDKVVMRLLNNGTTTACYFGSLHLCGTLALAKSVIAHRQRALVGKVSMNVENDAGYYNDTRTELSEAETFVEEVLSYNNELVQPVITPRFAVSCDEVLMKGLARIAAKYNCRVQTHISENKKEVEYVQELYPQYESYTDVYKRCGLLENRCVLAHAIYLSEEEMLTLKRNKVSVAHCPASNTRLKSGLCPVRRLLEKGITVGLGTDVSGGDNASILDAMRRAMDVSTHLELLEEQTQAIDWRGAFYLATLGGAKALFLDNVGSLEVSKDFDALVVDVNAVGPLDYHAYPETSGEEHILNLVQKFIYVGDDRNIVQVYVKGEKVKDVTQSK